MVIGNFLSRGCIDLLTTYHLLFTACIKRQLIQDDAPHDLFALVRKPVAEPGEEPITQARNQRALAALYRDQNLLCKMFWGHASSFAAVIWAVAARMFGACWAWKNGKYMHLLRRQCKGETACIGGNAIFASRIDGGAGVADKVR
jgi:hypothetical protein